MYVGRAVRDSLDESSYLWEIDSSWTREGCNELDSARVGLERAAR